MIQLLEKGLPRETMHLPAPTWKSQLQMCSKAREAAASGQQVARCKHASVQAEGFELRAPRGKETVSSGRFRSSDSLCMAHRTASAAPAGGS